MPIVGVSGWGGAGRAGWGGVGGVCYYWVKMDKCVGDSKKLLSTFVILNFGDELEDAFVTA